jgi:hypothetical protein
MPVDTREPVSNVTVIANTLESMAPQALSVAAKVSAVATRFTRSLWLKAKKSAPMVFAVTTDQDSITTLLAVVADLKWRLYLARDSMEAMQSGTLTEATIILYDKDLDEPDWRERLTAYSKLPQRPYLILLSTTKDDVLWREVVRRGGYEIVRRPPAQRELKRALIAGWMLLQNQRRWN